MLTLLRTSAALVFLLVAHSVHSAEIVQYALFEDPKRELSFEQVRQMEFQPVTEAELDFGSVYSDFWVQITLSNIPEQPHYLKSCFIQADELDVFLPESSTWRIVQTGDTRPFSARDVDHECYVFDLKNITDKTIFLRTHATTMSRVEVDLVEQTSFWQTQSSSQFWYGFYFAVLGSMIIYNLFLLLVTRDAAYFYYVGYLGSITLFLAEMSGHAVKHLWPDSQTWADYTPVMFATLAVAFGSRYIALITEAQRHAPTTAKLIYYCLPLAAITFFAAPFKGLAPIILLLVVVVIVLTLSSIAIFKSALAGYRPGYVMVFAICMMFPGAMLYFAQATNVIEESWLTSNSLYITSALEAMILSVALAFRIEVLNEEIEERGRQVRTLRERFSRTLLRTADNERRALARELHDGIGQGLLAIKNLVTHMSPADRREQAIGQIRALITDSRNLARNMHPQQIENLGFATALETMMVETIQPAGIQLDLQLQDLNGHLTHDTELQLYRIAQECASNIVRHSEASKVEVSVEEAKQVVTMTISDDGVGIEENKTPGIGLFNIQERAAIIGAGYQITSNSPSGTVVTISLPIK